MNQEINLTIELTTEPLTDINTTTKVSLDKEIYGEICYGALVEQNSQEVIDGILEFLKLNISDLSEPINLHRILDALNGKNHI
jgi:hypothetical protein